MPGVTKIVLYSHIAGLLILQCIAGVIELDDSFPTRKGNFPWLIEFYAPWCGHCRKLEPIYHQVYYELKDTEIRVAKVDATRFQGIASDYDVRGYPTIKFVQGENVYTHKGDRSRENIVEFARRAQGPAVRPLSNMGRFRDAHSAQSNGVMFVYVGPIDEMNDMYKKYKTIAERFAVLSYFYSGEKQAIPPNFHTNNEPTIICLKDGTHFEYKASKDGPTMDSIEEFINHERFQAFPKMSGGSLNELAELNKKIVMVITDETESHYTNNERLKDIFKMLASTKRTKYHKNFQFIWMGESDTANSITMSSLILPTVIVLEPDTQLHYLPETKGEDMTAAEAEIFLQQVLDKKLPAYGGSGILQRFKRLFYDIVMTIYDLYRTSGWLALVVIGVPTTVISIVCYALCCMEPIDDSMYEDVDDEEDEEKKALEDEAKQEALEDDGHIKKE